MIRFILILFVLCVRLIDLSAGDAVSRIGKSGDSKIEIASDSPGADKAAKIPVMALSGDETVIRKVFFINDNVPRSFRKPMRASVAVFWRCKDQSVYVRKIKKNGFNEQVVIEINGHKLVLDTADSRIPKNNLAWSEVSFPVQWLKEGSNLVSIYKKSQKDKDDYVYVGVDTSVEPFFSRISLDHGKNFAAYNRHFMQFKGEYMIRLILENELNEIEADFKNPVDISISGNAAVRNGVLKINGAPANAVLRNSEKFNVSEKGLTIAGVIRQLPHAAGSKRKDNNMMLAYKEGAWFIGRTGESFNFSFCSDGGEWNNASLGGQYPDIGTWMHIAAVFEYVNEAAQGNVGYKLLVYLNGELVTQKMFLYAKPSSSNEPVELGSGYHDEYILNGEMASFAVYNRYMNEAEINELVRRSDKVKNIRPGFVEVSQGLEKSFAALKKQAKNPEMRWLISALKRAAETGFSQPELSALLRTQRQFFCSNSGKSELIKQFNFACKKLQILESNGFMMLVATGGNSGVSPVLGIYNPKTKKEIAADRITGWQLEFYTGKVRDFSPGVSWQMHNLHQDNEGWKFQVIWKKSGELECISDFKFASGRLEQTLQVKNLDADKRLLNVVFPQFFVDKLPGKSDHLLFPLFSGVVRDDPTHAFAMAGLYPSARAAMQLTGYYDSDKNGVYFGYEAVDCAVKDLVVNGSKGVLECKFINPVALTVNTKGGNGFSSSGPGVLQVYEGDWFEAGQIYKKFVEAKAPWAVTELPRKDTPRWYRDNLFWTVEMCNGLNSGSMAAYLRDYFEVPYATWAGRWQYIGKESEPDLIPFPAFIEVYKKLAPKGIYIHPYLNARNWGFPEDVKTYYFNRDKHPQVLAGGLMLENGKIHQENYGKMFNVMCTATGIWQERLFKNAALLERLGAPGVYWDQLPCSVPKLCYNPDHGHAIGDPLAWVKGYWDMLERVRKTYPHLAMDGEDNCEVYVNRTDGFMTWRFTEPGHVPLFQSVYCGGRCQITGRAFDAFGPGTGSYHASFAKLGEQLVYGEQIGWMHFDDLRYASPRRLYAKKLIHLRKALLGYLNEADMLRPLDFRKPIPVIKEFWSGNATSGQRSRAVETAQVLHAPWKRLRDGRILIIFTNTMEKTMTVEPILNYPGMDKLAVCSESAGVKYIDLAKENIPVVTLPPLSTEIWLLGKEFDHNEAEAVGETTRKVAAFDAGKMIQRYAPRFGNVRDLKGTPGGKIAGKDLSWRMYSFREDVKSLGFNPALPEFSDNWVLLKKDAVVCFDSVEFGNGESDTVEFTVACRKDKSGGRITLWDVTGEGTADRLLAEFTVPDTGGWFTFKNFRVPLAKTSGRRLMMLRFSGNDDQECAWQKMTMLKTGKSATEFKTADGHHSSASFRKAGIITALPGTVVYGRNNSWYLAAKSDKDSITLNDDSLVCYNSFEFFEDKLPDSIQIQVSSISGGELILTDVTSDNSPYRELARFEVPAGTLQKEFTLPVKFIAGKRMLVFQASGEVTLYQFKFIGR